MATRFDSDWCCGVSKEKMKIRNLKREIRNKSEIRNYKSPNLGLKISILKISNLFRISIFEFRI